MDELVITLFSKYDDSIKKYSDLINHKEKKYLLNDISSISGIKSDGVLQFIDKEIFNLEVYFLGSYIHNENVWIWNWCHPYPKEHNLLGNKLINYALNFDDNKLKKEEFIFMRSMLVNSRIKIDMDFNFELLQGLIMYITNIKVIIPIKKKIGDIDQTFFYGIENPSNRIYL